VRVGMLLCSPAGGDLLFDESLTEQGRNFSNKIWNAFRLVKSCKTDNAVQQPAHSAQAIMWFDARLSEAVSQLDRLYDQFRLSEALMLLYRLFWDDFSSWYLEIVKPDYGKPLDTETYNATTGFFDKLLRLLHPVMPFITEELWQRLENREEGESIMVALMPEAGRVQKKMLTGFSNAMEIVSSIRTIRSEKNMPQKEPLSLLVKSESEEGMPRFGEVVVKLANLSGISIIDHKPANSLSFMVRTTEFFIPVEDKLDVEAETARIKKDLEYARGFLASVMRKLDNERFVKKAPEKVVQNEKAKKADAESRIAALEDRLRSLGG